MLFNSYAFLFLFLPTVFAGFFFIGRFSHYGAACWLALACLAFYSWWDYRFLPILIISILWNFGAGLLLLLLRLLRFRTLVLALAIAGDLALLGYFKYAGFFVGIFDSAAGTSYGPLHVVLPIGISFFTFTQIAFLVDTARDEVWGHFTTFR